MAEIAQVLQNLATTIAGLNVNRVPPPQPYTGLGSIEDWFVGFERYAEALYQQDFASYLQILPSFLEGEAKNIVLAFGTLSGNQYRTVKDRLVLEMSTRHAVGSNRYTDFFSTKRRPNESLVCYAIRLQSMAEKLPNATNETKAIMTKSKFLGGLPSTIARQVDIHMANNNNATLDQIVKLASILESERGCAAVASTQYPIAFVNSSVDPYLTWNDGHNDIPQLTSVTAPATPNLAIEGRQQQCYVCRATDHFARDCPIGKNTRCYNCHEMGHIAKNCRRERRPRVSGNNEQTGNRTNGGAVVSGSNRTSIGGGNGGLSCSFCGKKGHLMMDCYTFEKKLVVCVWCGESHASHTCANKPAGNGQASGR